MFRWITNLFKESHDEVEERLLTLFDFLLSEHGFSYAKEALGHAVDENGNIVFYGPYNAYQFYNGNICISILHLVQRDDYNVYISGEKSADQVLVRKGTELPSRLAYHLSLLAEEINRAISDHSEWYGYRF